MRFSALFKNQAFAVAQDSMRRNFNICGRILMIFGSLEPQNYTEFETAKKEFLFS